MKYEAASDSSAQISTNDFLVNAALAPGEYAIIPVNLRAFAPGNHMDHAGNILSSLPVVPNPQKGIPNIQREILKLFKGGQQEMGPLEPVRPLMITNLSEYYEDSTLPNSTQKMQMAIIPKYTYGINFCVIYRRDDKNIAVATNRR